jgi:hypothetical protein
LYRAPHTPEPEPFGRLEGRKDNRPEARKSDTEKVDDRFLLLPLGSD